MTAPPIYLDYAATTPVRPEVVAAMEPYWAEHFGNSGSAHRWGRKAGAAIEESRSRIAEALGARRREIVFVRGGTESDNLAILGRAELSRAQGTAPRVAVPATEHKAVLEAAAAVQSMGGTTTILPVDSEGRIEMAALDSALEAGLCCLSCMWVNNETGVMQPIPEIVERAHAAGITVHTDAVQAVGKIRVRVDEVPVDLLSLSGHKIYGPKSVGVLFVREGTEVHARLHGGGQESGLRPGTLDTVGVVGLAEAVCLAVEEQEAYQSRVTALRDRLVGGLRERLNGEVRVHGEHAPRAGHVVNVGLPCGASEMLMISLDLEGLAVSGGSACTSGSTAGSHVLRAMFGEDGPSAGVRFSFGRTTTEEEIDRAIAITARVVERLRPSGATA